MPKPPEMGQKNDLVVWLRLQPQQQRIYEVGPSSYDVQQIHKMCAIYKSNL